MNLILLDHDDFLSNERVCLTGRRFLHLRDVLRAEVGAKLRVGRVGGECGTGTVTTITEREIEMQVSLGTPPPKPIDLTLFLALPRPKFLARCLQTATSLGVKRIFLINSYRVDKIYWSCQQLEPSEIREACALGLEQAQDTVFPKIHLRRLFKPFVEDELPGLVANTTALMGHPHGRDVCPFNVDGPVSLAIGPEGGFIDYEIEKLAAAGFRAVKTYDRILKVETAIASMIGRLK